MTNVNKRYRTAPFAEHLINTCIDILEGGFTYDDCNALRRRWCGRHDFYRHQCHSQWSLTQANLDGRWPHLVLGVAFLLPYPIDTPAVSILSNPPANSLRGDFSAHQGEQVATFDLTFSIDTTIISTVLYRTKQNIRVWRSWYRAWFGTKRPWVQVPPLGPKMNPLELLEKPVISRGSFVFSLTLLGAI